jgi:hypothetical protein
MMVSDSTVARVLNWLNKGEAQQFQRAFLAMFSHHRLVKRELVLLDGECFTENIFDEVAPAKASLTGTGRGPPPRAHTDPLPILSNPCQGHVPGALEGDRELLEFLKKRCRRGKAMIELFKIWINTGGWYG